MAEERADVVRNLVKEVAWVVLPVHSVEGAAAVGMEEAAQKLPRKPLNDPGLPQSELDLAPMLPTRPVLREECRPRLRVRTDLHSAGGQALDQDPILRITAAIAAAHSAMIAGYRASVVIRSL
jgi:hypothetical protein